MTDTHTRARGRGKSLLPSSRHRETAPPINYLFLLPSRTRAWKRFKRIVFGTQGDGREDLIREKGLFLFKLNVSYDTGCKYLEVFLVFSGRKGRSQRHNAFCSMSRGRGWNLKQRRGEGFDLEREFLRERLRRIDKRGMLFGERRRGKMEEVRFMNIQCDICLWIVIKNWRGYFGRINFWSFFPKFDTIN